MSDSSPKARTWLILGAATPLGRAFERRATAAGDRCVRISRRPERHLVSDGRADPEGAAAPDRASTAAGARWLGADIATEAGRSSLREAVHRALGDGPAGLFLGHGMYDPRPAAIPLMEDTLYRGPSLLLRSLLPVIADGADLRVVAIGSAAAHRPRPRNPAYADAKARWEVCVEQGQRRLAGGPGRGRLVLAVPGYLAAERRMKPADRPRFRLPLPKEPPEVLAARLLTWSAEGRNGGVTHPVWRPILAMLDRAARLGWIETPYETARRAAAGHGHNTANDTKWR